MLTQEGTALHLKCPADTIPLVRTAAADAQNRNSCCQRGNSACRRNLQGTSRQACSPFAVKVIRRRNLRGMMSW